MEWTPSEKTMKHWGEWAQKPFIITEFYTKGMDSGLANTTGAGFTVQTQQEICLSAFCFVIIGKVEIVSDGTGFCIADNDPTAKGADPSNLDLTRTDR